MSLNRTARVIPYKNQLYHAKHRELYNAFSNNSKIINGIRNEIGKDPIIFPKLTTLIRFASCFVYLFCSFIFLFSSVLWSGGPRKIWSVQTMKNRTLNLINQRRADDLCKRSEKKRKRSITWLIQGLHLRICWETLAITMTTMCSFLA